jgi:type I restriction-modification system DNA methylase subunit
LPEPPTELIELVHKFDRNLDAYKNPSYKEEQLKQEFINPFFKALGWDVDNVSGAAPQYRDVIFEDSIKVGGGTKAPDYCFTLAGRRMFFVEAKKPSVNVKMSIEPSYQLRRYAWSAKLPLSILTDFEELAVYESRTKPQKKDRASTGRILFLTYKDYVEKWDEIYSIFSREAVLQGSFDKFAEATKKKRGTTEVDDAFLSEIEEWRELFAKNIALRNQEITIDELNYAVQQTIDRIVFLRMCEDRGVEKYEQLRNLLDDGDIYQHFGELCLKADEKYNSGLFHFKEEKDRGTPPDKLTLDLKIDDNVFKTIIKNLYYPNSPYEFSVISPEILGNVYEQFLGKVIRLTPGHQAKIEEKPEVKKAGGVYYTPQFIVDYIVENTVGKLCKDKTPNKVSKLRILDPACGSGSFLLGAYTYLLKWHRDYYTNQKDKKRLKDKIYQGKGGEYYLTIREKKRILLNNIYGVDIDPQAVNVTKLSLLLKVLEGENRDALEAQQKLFRERALPDLVNNIKCGNSLIGPDIYDDPGLALTADDIQRINPFDWYNEFYEIMNNGGFDAVIGNPPYVRQETLKGFKKYFKDKYSVFHSLADLYTYFIEMGIKLLNINGIFSYITSNKWIKANYGEPLRKWLKKFSIDEIIDFGDLSVFKNVAAYPSIIKITNKNPVEKFNIIKVKNLNFLSLKDYVSKNSNSINYSDLEDEGWSLVDVSNRNLLVKLQKSALSLGEYLNGEVYRGITSGLDKAFVINRKTCEKLISEDINNKILIKPYAAGKDIKQYQYPDTDKFLLYIPWELDINKFKSIKTYLLNFQDKLKNRPEVKAGRFKWYALSRYASEYYKEFEKPKIMYLKFQVKPVFTIDYDGYFPNSAIWIIPLDDKYLLGILNSKLGWFMISNYCTKIRGGYQLIFKYLKKIPIQTINFEKPTEVDIHASIVTLVGQMFQLHKDQVEVKTPDAEQRIQRQIAAIDNQINNLVYKLYELTDEEIMVIEDSINNI